MKKIIAIFWFLAIFSLAFSKDILGGKSFNIIEETGNQVRYDFLENGKLQVVFDGEAGLEYNYKINPKNQNLTLKLARMSPLLAGLANDSTLLDTKEIVRMVKSEDFYFDSIYDTHNLPKDLKKYVSKGKNWQQDFFNVFCFAELQGQDESSKNLEYDPKTDYFQRLTEVLNYSEEQKTSVESYIKNSISSFYDSIPQKIAEGSIVWEFLTNPEEIYDFSFDGENLTLTENPKEISVGRTFAISEFSDAISVLERPCQFVFRYAVVALEFSETESKCYLPKKLPKKDSGTIRYVNLSDKSDFFDLKYKISRTEEVVVDAEILSGDLKGKKFTMKANLETNKLVLEK